MSLMQRHCNDIQRLNQVCLAVCSGADQRKHPRSASLAFVKGNPLFDDVIMRLGQLTGCSHDSSDYQPQSSAFMVLCAGNARVRSGFSVQRAINIESVSMS